MTLLFLLKFLLFQPKRPSKKSTFVLNFWLFHWEKSEKLHYMLQKMRNWWNFNGIKENSIQLSVILMG